MNNKAIKQILLIILIIILFILLLWQFYPLINGLLGALALHIAFRKYHTKLSNRKGWNNITAASFIITGSIIIILLPVIYISKQIIDSFQIVILHYEKIWIVIHQAIEQLEYKVGMDLVNMNNVKEMSQQFATYIPSFFNSTLGVISEVIIMYFTLYFTLTEKVPIENWIRNHLPFNRVNNIMLLTELEKSTISNLSNIPLIAVSEAFISWIFYILCNVDNAFSFAILTGIASILPVVGTALIWFPITIYLLIMGNIWQGVLLFSAGALIISNFDNLLRMTILNKNYYTHPLITIFGIILGLKIIGFMGIIFGPIILNYFIILFDIYKNEFT